MIGISYQELKDRGQVSGTRFQEKAKSWIVIRG